jgi:hypothetical protein
VAQVESTGGATVYRFTEPSVRHAFDVGWGAADVHQFLAKISRTPVPQPLRYLVDEVARSHGRVRVSPVASVVRLEDPTIGDALLGDPKLTVLRLRRLAPTVLASQRSAQSVLDTLRDAGHPVVAESSTGELMVGPPAARRAPVYRTARGSLTVRLGSPAAAEALVRALRAGDRARQSRPAPGLAGAWPLRPVETMSSLRQAAAAGRTVWIGYVDNNGSASERLVDPLRIQDGWLTAYDHIRDAVRIFALHRITGVALIDVEPGAAEPPRNDHAY